MVKSYVIGVDFGTDSVRSVLVDASDGDVLATSVFVYPRWEQGLYCDPAANRFRQHPLDHLEGLEYTVRHVVKEAGVPAEQVRGIGVDTTGSSPMPITGGGVPLAFTKAFQDNPNAQMILWKDHTAIREADEITQLARSWGGVDYTAYSGGIYSSEWFWAKILKLYRIDAELEAAKPNWVEHCDYITGELTGQLGVDQIKRSRCAAGHKAMWHESWSGFPSTEFLEILRPSLAELKNKLRNHTYLAIDQSGKLCSDWAKRLGLSTATIVSVGTIDAHAGAAGAGIQPGTLVKVMGTSTCDLLVARSDEVGPKPVIGISGQVNGSIIPDMVGFEAGQAGFGDLLAWFKQLVSAHALHTVRDTTLLSGDIKVKLEEEISDGIWDHLTREAEKTQAGMQVMAIDWINGRRSPDVNESLKAAITGIGMGTGVGEIYRSLVESLCFGSKRIVERFERDGVTVKHVKGVGGIAKKSPFLVQTMANVLGKPIEVVDSEQTPALGSAMYAAVASGVYHDFKDAVSRMAGKSGLVYNPSKELVEHYDKVYRNYIRMGDFLERGM